MKLNITEQQDQLFIDKLKQLVQQARQSVYSAINFAQVEQNWLIGQQIVEQEQFGKQRAEYGKYIIQVASQELTAEFGKGFSVTNIKNFRKFYLLFDQTEIGQTVSDQSVRVISQTVSDRLSWSHYERLIRVNNQEAREWYVKEASEQNWSVRTLDRNISTQYYNRLIASQIKVPVEQEMKAKTNELQNKAFDFIKNPSVLEFLNLPSHMSYTEQKLETLLIDNLQQFILELGKGFAFVERQQLFASKYLSYLPGDVELKAEIIRQREVFESQQNMEELGYGESS